MKFKIITILLYLSIALFIYTEENPEANTKAVEFSVGGGLKGALSFSYFYLDYNGRYFDTYGFGGSFGITVPISFVYYVNNNFGIGFNYKLSCTYPLVFEGMTLTIDNYLNMVNKVGNNGIGKFLLLEYGIISSWKHEFLNFTSYEGNRFYLGPNIFIGYEKRSKKDWFLFTIGGFFDAQFKLTVSPIIYYENGYTFKEANQILLNTGIEVRWRYCNFTRIK